MDMDMEKDACMYACMHEQKVGGTKLGRSKGIVIQQ